MEQIRKMTKNDWDDVLRIYSQGISEGASTFQTNAPSYEAWDESHITVCRYVVIVDGNIAGWCALSPTSKRDSYKGVVEVSIYVDKDYRGKGLGQKLLKYLVSQSEKQGYWSLYSAVFSINKASLKIHKNCGFRVVGTREKIAKDRFGDWQDTTILEKRNNIY